MSDFERKIRDLPWRKSSEALGERIFGAASQQRFRVGDSDRNMPIKWSVVLAMAAGFLGFVAGAMLPSRAPINEVASVVTDIRVVETFSQRNSFDFSADAIQILPGEFTAYIDVEAETTR